MLFEHNLIRRTLTTLRMLAAVTPLRPTSFNTEITLSFNGKVFKRR